jgi:tetratricopeptide (TPR) repeat protein
MTTPSASLPTPAQHPWWQSRWLARLALFAITAAAAYPYLVTLTFGYTYDDVVAIAGDARRHTWSALWTAWTQSYWRNPDSGLYRPLAQFLWAVMWEAGGGHALIFRIVTVALHVATAVMVWIFLERAASRSAAWLAALLFAVDPVHVEAIGSIANSTEIMVTLLAVMMMFVVWRAADRTPPGVSLRWGAAILAGITYLLALGAKESAGAAPALVLLCWWGWRTPAQDEQDAPAPRFFAMLLRGWRVWVAATIALVIAVVARYFALGRLALNPDFVAPGIRESTGIARVWTMIAAWPVVGKLLFWPSKLIMYYGKDIVVPHDGMTTRAALSLLVVGLALTAAAVLARRGDRRPLVALLWIGLAYFPASNLLVPTGQLLAERTLYLPSVGAAMLVAWAIERVSAVLAQRVSTVRVRIALALPVVLVALVGATRANSAVLPWQDSYTLFVSGIEATPTTARPYMLLGNWYTNKGDQKRALAYLAYARRLDPLDPIIVIHYAAALHRAGQYETELGLLRDAAQHISNTRIPRTMLLNALGEQRGADSLIAFLHSVPQDWVDSYWRSRFLGAAYHAKGMQDSVRAVYRAALAKEPENGMLHYAFADMLELSGSPTEAAAQLSLAERDKVITRPAILSLRARIALSQGDTAAARRAIAAALILTPNDSGLTTLAARLDSATAHRPSPPRADSTSGRPNTH